MEGHKFFRDKKMSANAVKDFVKNAEELNNLGKKETFFVTETIKKLWSKISFLFYLFNSMNKAITSFKKKASINPTLHEGLLLLIHEHFHAQTIRKNPIQGWKQTRAAPAFP